jgi:histone-lysine N-methyltransferase SETMAR
MVGYGRVIQYGLLKMNLTVTVECYCQQLRRLEEAIQQKRPGRRYGVILQHDNARPHTANMTKAAIQELDCDWRFFQSALLSGPCPIGLPPLPLSL